MDYDFMQVPAAKLVDTGDNKCVLMLENWNCKELVEGYTEEETKSLIEMLQQSLDLMSRYNRLNEKLPLFESQGDNAHVHSESSTQRES